MGRAGYPAGPYAQIAASTPVLVATSPVPQSDEVPGMRARSYMSPEPGTRYCRHLPAPDRWTTVGPVNAFIAKLFIHSPPLPSGARENGVTGHAGNATRVHAVPFRCSRNDARLLLATTKMLPGDTARRSPNIRPASALRFTWPQVRPLYRSMMPNGAVALLATAQMSRGDRALAH